MRSRVPGTFDIAVKAIKAAKAKGFRVYTNTTIFQGSKPEDFHGFFDYVTDELHVDGMQLSPGYRYEKAPDQDHFLAVEETRQLFRGILAPYRAGKKKWEFNASPFFLDFLTGEKDYDCTPWGMPSYSLFGWQKPCYLLGEGYANELQRAARDDRVGKVRSRERQPEVRRLHGALGLRSDGGGRHDAAAESDRFDPHRFREVV